MAGICCAETAGSALDGEWKPKCRNLNPSPLLVCPSEQRTARCGRGRPLRQLGFPERKGPGSHEDTGASVRPDYGVGLFELLVMTSTTVMSGVEPQAVTIA
ncbi:MAG: hypothetical protein JWQ89_4242 [Devosia sp.]|nr:hypothetical protein [Devosia sp.]